MARQVTRKPVDQAPSPREIIWAAIRARKDTPFTAAEMVAATSAEQKTIRDYCKGLVAAGYLQQLPAPAGTVITWQLIKDIGVEAPRVRPDGSPVTQGIITEQLWRGMTMLKDFSYDDLVQSATVAISDETAKAYCKMLLAAGYLRVLVKADPASARRARYRLIRNKGPKAPMIQRIKQVYDPNSREIFPVEERL